MATAWNPLLQWNTADTPLLNVYHVTQVHKFSRTKRTLEVRLDERSVRAIHKGKPPKTYSASAFVNIELTSGAGITARIHEKNQKRPKKYIFDSTRDRDRFVSLVRGLQKNKPPPLAWFHQFDTDNDGMISIEDIEALIALKSEEQQQELCRGSTAQEMATVMLEWCEMNRDRPLWSGLDYYEFVRFVIFIARDFTVDRFFALWCEVATASDITRTRSGSTSVDPSHLLPGEHSWNETPHVSWIFNSENMGYVDECGGNLLCLWCWDMLCVTL